MKFRLRKRTVIKQSYISFFKVPKHLFWNNFKNSQLSDLSSYWLSKSSQYSAVVTLVFRTKVKEQNWRKSWTKTPVSKKFCQNLIFLFRFLKIGTPQHVHGSRPRCWNAFILKFVQRREEKVTKHFLSFFNHLFLLFFRLSCKRF